MPFRPPRPAQDQLPRLLPTEPGTPPTLAAHLARFGGLPYRGGPHLLITGVQAAGLTGRGGAAFPVHRKLTAVASQRRRPIVVGNGAEGDAGQQQGQDPAVELPAPGPGRPAAGRRGGQRRPRGPVPASPPGAAPSASPRRSRSGPRPPGPDRSQHWSRHPPRFLAGEESSLASKLNGGLARPTFKQPRVFERGVAEPAHPGAERRDPGPPGPDRPLRGGPGSAVWAPPPSQAACW